MDSFYKGELVERVDKPNLVVTPAAQICAALLNGLTGGGTPTPAIASVGFGTNSAPANVANTAITDPFIKAVNGVVYSSMNPGMVTFDFALGSGDANGMTIWEYGLLTGTGILFARSVRSSGIAKTSAWSFTGSWSITFSVG